MATHEQTEDDTLLVRFPELPEGTVVRETRSLFRDYLAFVKQGNVVDLGIAVVVGTSFSALVTSFAADILSPLLGAPTSARLTELYLTVHRGKAYPYKTRAAANADGAVTWNYGLFLQTLLNFVCISGALFVLMKLLATLRRQDVENETIKECPYCVTDIAARARKCPSCTADLARDPVP